jgi:hypothetical protein
MIIRLLPRFCRFLIPEFNRFNTSDSHARHDIRSGCEMLVTSVTCVLCIQVLPDVTLLVGVYSAAELVR